MYNPAIHAASAAAARRMREEEEKMTKYNGDDLEGWEFKIVRSNFGSFRNYKRVQEVCKEEEKAGWEMLEKFDNYRIRFKRRVEKRSNDQFLTVDPYRTNVGLSGLRLAGLIIFIVAVLMGVGMLIASQTAESPEEEIPIAIPIALFALAVVAVLVTRFRR